MSAFPVFPDGDVLIVLSGIRLFRLHSGILRHASKVFETLLSEDHGAKLTPKAKREGATVRWRLDLLDVEKPPGFLVRAKVDSAGRTGPISTPFDNENGQLPPELFIQYETFFKALYNEPITLEKETFRETAIECFALVQIVEYCGSVNAITDLVDNSLLRWGQQLHKSIQRNPANWCNFGFRIRSKTLFKEALIHCVGRWRALSEEDQKVLHDEVALVVRRKFLHLQLFKQAIEMRVLSHYPASITFPPEPTPGRMQYSSCIYMWMGIAFFRHWMAQINCENRGMYGQDGGYDIYRRISQGGQQYLRRHEECELFHAYFPMTERGKGAFENQLALYKSELQAFVAPLMVNNSQLDTSADQYIGHLLCTEVEARDYPWLKGIAGSPGIGDETLEEGILEEVTQEGDRQEKDAMDAYFQEDDGSIIE